MKKQRSWHQSASMLCGCGLLTRGTQRDYSIGDHVCHLNKLGACDRSGAVQTRYGTRQKYFEQTKALHQQNISVYVDLVVNHPGGGFAHVRNISKVHTCSYSSVTKKDKTKDKKLVKMTYAFQLWDQVDQ